MDKNLFLSELFVAGKPLVEVGISPAEGVDIDDIAKHLHDIAPDIELRQSHYGLQTLEGDATAEAMERLFGFKLRRVNIPRWDQDSNSYDGVYEDGYMWKAEVDWSATPPELEGKIVSVGFSQPGTNDAGRPDDVKYELPPAIYDVSRIDDHGNSFHVATFFTEIEANNKVAKLESAVHKQTYFIDKRQP